MLDTIETSRANTEFFTKLATLNGQQEASRQGAQYLKTELLETCIVNSIIAQAPITADQCQRNVKDTSLHLIRDIEPTAVAVGVDILGQPDGKYIRGERYLIPVVHYTTAIFEIVVEDLMSYQYNITERIQDKSVPYLDRAIDTSWFHLCGAALCSSTAGTQKIVKSGHNVAKWLSYVDVVNLCNTLASGVNGRDPKKLELALILMTQEVAATSAGLVGAGDNFGKDRVLNGVPTETLFGHKVVTTIKSDILPIGHLWGFADGEFLGHNYSVGETHFEIFSKFGLVQWQSKCTIAMGIGNARALALLPIYGTVSPADGTTPLTCTTTGTVDADIVNYYKGLRV